jgi:hypothetical protein
MESFYRGQNPNPTYTGMEDGQGHANLMSMSPVDGMDGMDGIDAGSMMRGDTLDDIIMQNNKEMERRRSVQQFRPDQAQQQSMADPHRSSMLEFGPGSHGNLNGYPFDPSTASQGRGNLHRNSAIIQPQISPQDRNPDGSRRPSTGNLALNTQFPGMSHDYSQMPPPPTFPSPMPQEPTMNPQDSYNTPGLPTGLQGSMSMDFSGNGMEHVSARRDATPMNIYGQNQHSFPPNLDSPHLTNLGQSFSSSVQGSQDDPGGGSSSRRTGSEVRTERDVMSKVPSLQMADNMQRQPSNPLNNSTNRGNASPIVQRTHSMGTTSSNESIKQQGNPERGSTLGPERGPMPTTASTGDVSPSPNQSIRLIDGKGKPQNAYSSTGFDMLSVLVSRVLDLSSKSLTLCR